MKKFFFVFAMIITLGCLAAVGYSELFYSPTITFTGDLKTIIPTEYPGWKVEERDLDVTEAGIENAQKILKLTQFVHREYTRGSTHINVYIAYWKPKVQAVRHVQSHTPDVCWVRNGMKLIEDESKFSVSCSVNDQALFPAEMRTLTDKEETITRYAAYWHVIGDEIYVNRSEAGQWDRWDPIKTLMKYGLHQQKEQFFIRISSNQPIEEIWNTPLMQEILADLAELALTPPEAPANS